jgi:hypothetical protein
MLPHRLTTADRPWVEIANAAISTLCSSPLPFEESLSLSLSSSSAIAPASPASTDATAAVAYAA